MITLLLLALLAAGPAVAAQEFDPAARAKTIAPFIDEQTFALVYVDFSRLRTSFVDLLAGVIPDLDESEATRLKGLLLSMRGAFMQAGGKDLYVVMSMSDLPLNRPLFVVPLSAGADEEALAKVELFGLRGLVAERARDCLLLGDHGTLARARGIQPDPRPELAGAFRAAGDTAAQAVLIPPKYTARVIEEMLPTLPPEIGDGPSSVITRGLTWAVASANLSPQVSVKLVIQSQDNQAAKALLEKYGDLVEFLGKDKNLRKTVPAFDKLTQLLTPKVQGDRLTITLDEKDGGLAKVLSFLARPITQGRMAAKRSTSMNNLKQIGLAMHNYHDVHKSFPAAAGYDADGKPLLSWRVHILFFIDDQLYRQFHLDEPWDSEHNRRLIEKMPAVYRSPGSKLSQEKGRTSYVVAVGRQTVFPGQEGIPMREIKDGTVDTIMAVEVDDEHAVIWTKPEDLPFDPNNPARGLGGLYEGTFLALFCDGWVHVLSEDIDPKVLRQLFTRAGGEVIPPGSY
jgi:hypothetical protein